MILVYTHTITNRLQYTLNLVFETVLNIKYHVTDDIEVYHTSFIPKIAYTSINKGFGAFIQSDELLFEDYIRQEITTVLGHDPILPVFFKCSDSILPYDIFATVFYFTTRYEEYVSQQKDKHQRFKAEDSIAFKAGILQIPYLNYLIRHFAEILKEHFDSLVFPPRKFNFLSTIDIDNAFAFAHKGLTRNTGGFIKDVISLKFQNAGKRVQSNFDADKDPYNTFDLINNLSEESNTALQYFVLIGDHSAYDKNPDHRNNGFRNLLKKIAKKHSVGLHPSYESFNDLKKITIEKERLEQIIERKITSARCHFLRIQFPDTYINFLENGITDDYTMIYASQCGFRTGLCVPYKWFDLQNNIATELTIHTSVVMEGILRDYNNLEVDDANKIIINLLKEVKSFGGEFISVFHNDTFVPEQKNWIEMYKQMLNDSKI